MDLGITLMGLLVGSLVGLTGVGGAALLTPVLLMLGISPSIAVGTDLFYNAVTKLFGTVMHIKQKTVNLAVVKYLAFGSIPGAIVAVIALYTFDVFFNNQDELIKHALGIMLIVVAIATIYRQFSHKEHYNRWHIKSLQEKVKLLIILGFVLGFVVGLTSIGSGSLFAMMLIYLFSMKGSEIVGTDIAHAFLLVTVAGILHAFRGHVDYLLAFNLLCGSIPGVLLGSMLSTALPSRPLRTFVATLILISGIKLI